jgi:hypothetical protein
MKVDSGFSVNRDCKLVLICAIYNVNIHLKFMYNKVIENRKINQSNRKMISSKTLIF